MDLDQPELVGVAYATKGADEVPRLYRPPCPGREHEPGLWPGRAHVCPVHGLPSVLELERLASKVKQRKVTLPGMGLDRAELELATNALKLLANVDRPGHEVNILPAQSESFAT